MFLVYGEWGDEVGNGVAEGWAGSGWSVCEGSSDSGFSVHLKLEVEVFHDGGGVVCGGGASDVVFVDYGDAASVFVSMVSVHTFCTRG